MRTTIPWWRIIKWCILAVAVGGLGFYVYCHLNDFRILSDINPSILIWVILVSIIHQVVGAIRSYGVMRFLGLRISVSEWLRVFIFARILTLTAPQSGNVYRATVLKVRHGFLIKNYIAAYSAYTILSFLSAFCYTILAILATEPGLMVMGYPVALILLLLLAASITGFYALGRLSTSAKDIARRWGRWPSAINKTFIAMIACLKNIRLIVSIVSWGALTFTLGATANWLCFADLGSYPGLARIAVYSLVSGMSYLVYLTPGNIGIREGAYGIISSGMGELAATGIIVALILRVTGFVSLMLLGAFLGGADILKKSTTSTIKQ